jgi:hypothetical protein
MRESLVSFAISSSGSLIRSILDLFDLLTVPATNVLKEARVTTLTLGQCLTSYNLLVLYRIHQVHLRPPHS